MLTKHNAHTMQTTLENKVSCSGVGLHSGSQINLVVYPAPADTGIVFKRTDVAAKQALIPALYDNVCDTRLGTTIRNRHGVTVSTIEHLMAAFWGVGIDNAIVELDGPEVPIMDGSSEPFVFMLECAHIAQLSKARRTLRILKAVEVREGESVARITPNLEMEEGCIMGIEIQFNDKVIKRQVSEYDFRETTFKKALARARTFCFEQEVNALRQMGRALGGSLDNAIVVGAEGVLNEGGLRYNDEFVRHKALDCLGDLFLAGYRIDARLDFLRPGHGINNKLLRAVFADKTAFAITEPGKIEVIFPYVQEAIQAYA